MPGYEPLLLSTGLAVRQDVGGPRRGGRRNGARAGRPGFPMNASLKLSEPASGRFWEIPVLYEDDQLLALNKPAGLAVSSDPANPGQLSLLRLLHAAIAEGKSGTRERGLGYVANAHRLDAEVTGVLLLARSKAALAALANAFGEERPLRLYTALVQGAPEPESFEMEAKLAPDQLRPGLMRIDPRQGKRSRTRFSVLEKFSRWTLLRCEALTDRSHQVRLHLRYARYPVVGDGLYGGKPLLLSRLKPDYRLKPKRTERPLLSTAALHCEQISFPHPATGETKVITAPWPKDLTVAVKYLRKFAAKSPG